MMLLMGAVLVGNAVAALMEQVCCVTQNRTIDPWLRSLPMNLHIAPTSLVARGLAKFDADNRITNGACSSCLAGSAAATGLAV
jgi:hypothetical protein